MAQREEKEMDYLEPFLIQMDVVDVKNVKLTRQQALKLRDDCLANLKQRLIDKANLIQARFEKVSLKSCTEDRRARAFLSNGPRGPRATQ